MQGFFDVVSFIVILIFVVPFVIIALCCYLNQIREGVQEWKRLDQEKKRREYKICAAFCIITWIAIAIMMILIGGIM
ncbi:MAG: hypothetical protein EAX95_15605 [Candidatus Thorarchaeota archaeon]|nr:hypothetical protein [Candidatus Thorarchaeota archaeon]